MNLLSEKSGRSVLVHALDLSHLVLFEKEDEEVHTLDVFGGDQKLHLLLFPKEQLAAADGLQALHQLDKVVVLVHGAEGRELVPLRASLQVNAAAAVDTPQVAQEVQRALLLDILVNEARVLPVKVAVVDE